MRQIFTSVLLLVALLCANHILAVPYTGTSGEAADRSSSVSRQTSCPCGMSNKEGRIVGGKATLKNEFPFILQVILQENNFLYCAASILTPTHAVTAAHCIKDKPMAVIAGAHSSYGGGPNTQMVRVSRSKVHEAYSRPTLMHDIAVLFLEKPLKFNKYVSPVCVPNTLLNLENKYVKIIGWGLINGFGNIGTEQLREVDVKVTPANTCKQIFHDFLPNPRFPTQICTFGNGKGGCMGDSGGPIVYLDPETNRYTLVGLVSYGHEFCDPKLPSIATDVSVYMPWLEPIINEPLCHKV